MESIPPVTPPVISGGDSGGWTVKTYTLAFDYEMPVETHVLMPRGARVLHVFEEKECVKIAALVNTDYPLERRCFVVLPAEVEYYKMLGAYYGMAFDFHVFEK